VKEDRTQPTMIIPRGTEIGIDANGQLSIRTPGSLVMQNSGTFAEISCANGSLRIDREVSVEAVTVRVADTCHIAGTLTAWEVQARRIVLEDGASACVMVRDSEVLEVDKQARMVGNFGSEAELVEAIGRFNEQLRDLPQTAADEAEAPTPIERSFARAAAAADDD